MPFKGMTSTPAMKTMKLKPGRNSGLSQSCRDSEMIFKCTKIPVDVAAGTFRDTDFGFEGYKAPGKDNSYKIKNLQARGKDNLKCFTEIASDL
jgi:hypothetical protein